MPCAEKVMFCNSGTEASMYAIRAARAFSGKRKIAMFEGGFNGAHDGVLAKVVVDSPADRPEYFPMGDGIAPENQVNLMMLPYMRQSAIDLIRESKDDLALVIIEPVQGANPRLDQGDFLGSLADVCKETRVLLCFDEIITGFRLAYGGGQEYFGVVPDMAITGKVPGGGMPLGVVTGRADVMEVFHRQFNIYRGENSGGASVFTAGTFNGNPMSMTAGRAALTYLKDHQEIYPYMAEQVTRLADEINDFCTREELPAHIVPAASMFSLVIQRGGPIRSGRDIDMSLRDADHQINLYMEKHEVMMPPLHLCFVSAAHSPEDIDTVIDALKKSLKEVRADGLI
jgi:glutamate-1-semialdehyde 2,1-aminomutase